MRENEFERAKWENFLLEMLKTHAKKIAKTGICTVNDYGGLFRKTIVFDALRDEHFSQRDETKKRGNRSFGKANVFDAFDKNVFFEILGAASHLLN